MKGETETMVSDQEIARGVEILLRQHPHHPSFSSVNGVVQQLGAKLGLDLSHKASFIRDHINLLRQSQPPPQHQQQQPPVFGFQNHQQHSQFLQFYQQQQQQQQQQQRYHIPPQQQQQFSPQFGFQFSGGFPCHAPLQHPHAHPQIPHAPPKIPHAPPQIPTQQAVLPAPSIPTPKNGSKASKESTQSGGKRRGGAGGLNKLCGVSPELQVVVGEAAMARTEIVRQLWVYIRKNGLQDPSNKRKIICDDVLRALFETDCTDMFKMNKLLTKHILPYDPSKDSTPSKRQKVDVESTAEPTEGPSPVKISDALALFLGTTEKEMLPSEATQRVVEYIKVNNLEDSSSMTVNCDEKLRTLFGCESVPVVGINDLLVRDHLHQSSS